MRCQHYMIAVKDYVNTVGSGRAVALQIGMNDITPYCHYVTFTHIYL